MPEDGDAPSPLGHPGASFLFLGLSLLCEIFIVIYPSLIFILLLHLSVIQAYPQVHVPSAILSGALWTAVAPIVLSRGHIHINGVILLFILLLHLSVIQAYPQVHAPMTILFGALWTVVAPIVLSRGHIHINGVRVLAVGI